MGNLGGLNEGDWVMNSAGQGGSVDASAIPTHAGQTRVLLWIAAGAALMWFLKR